MCRLLIKMGFLPSHRLAAMVEEGQISVKDAVKGTFGYMAPGNMWHKKLWQDSGTFGDIMAKSGEMW